MTACHTKDDYNKLNEQYTELLEEKNNLEKISSWFDLYNSIEMGKTYNQISELFDFDYARYNKVSGVNAHTMEAYKWKNKKLFDDYDLEENQIVVVFCDGVSMYKQYGDVNFILDSNNGTVVFPADYIV